MYSQLPEKIVKTMIVDLLGIKGENESINKNIQDMFTNLCENSCHYECIKLLIDSGKVNVEVGTIIYASINDKEKM